MNFGKKLFPFFYLLFLIGCEYSYQTSLENRDHLIAHRAIINDDDYEEKDFLSMPSSRISISTTTTTVAPNSNSEKKNETDQGKEQSDGENKTLECKPSSPSCALWKGGICGSAPLNDINRPVVRHKLDKSELFYRINGGFDQTYGSWPSYVKLDVDMRRLGRDVGLCSGVLITGEHVLTAAHCTISKGDKILPSEFKLYIGDDSLMNKDEHEINLSVKSVCVSKNYYDNEAEGVRNDYAILTLERPVNFTNYIQPACLPYDRDRYREITNNSNIRQCHVVGAGLIEARKFRFPDKVQHMRVEKVPCDKWGLNETDVSRHCFTKSDGQGDTCGGDSGGPILCSSMHNGKEVWTVVGLVSYGSRYCDGQGPHGYTGVYTRIPSLMEQILSDCPST